MKVLILGSSGQLGTELKKKINSISLSQKKNRINYFDKGNIYKHLNKHSPNLIINCVAYTDVNNAENEKSKCKYLNFKFPQILAKFCKKNNIILIHFSTDYVFNGKKKFEYDETSKTSPLNYYGLTKLKGDECIMRSGCKYYIFRISWLYNIKFKDNFIYKVKSKIINKISFSLPQDQVGAPISSDLVSKYIDIFIKKLSTHRIIPGIFNLSSSSYASRYQIGLEISKILKKKHNIKPFNISQKEKSNYVKRPLNSRLNLKKLEKIIKIKILNWKKDLRYNLLYKK